MGSSEQFWDLAGQQPLLGAVTAASCQRVQILLVLVGGSNMILLQMNVWVLKQAT